MTDPVARRASERKARQTRNMMIVSLAVGAVALVAVAGAAVLLLAPSVRVKTIGPRESIEGEGWNHAELISHLESRGVHLEYRPARGDASAAVVIEAAPEYRLIDMGRGMTVEKWPTRAAAHDRVGQQSGAYRWGRFVFDGPTELVGRVRAALR